MKPSLLSVLLIMLLLLPAGCSEDAAPASPPATQSPAPPTNRPDAPATFPATAPAPVATPLPGTQPILLPRNDIPGLTNFAQVSPVLYRGAQPTAQGFVQLKKMGIKTVVNLRSFHSDRDLMKGTGLRYVSIASQAWNPEEKDILRFLKIVENPDNQPVFVHCQQGADRTGCAVAAYRMVEQGWTRQQAMAELPRFDFHPIWTEISEYLAKFDPARTQQKLRTISEPDLRIIN